QIKKLLEGYKKTGDTKIKELIINSQLKDILYLCLNYLTLHKSADIQDLVQIANIGLIEAIEKYNPQARVEFKDYMVYYIRENIKKEFEEKTNG
ncbi:MAG: sigma-70 family RNA polymerase sigma factor, partial [Clostridia bacterium]|nr:sigma-70 family RNA polymerase sigma factor [Clostridia bacterium]